MSSDKKRKKPYSDPRWNEPIGGRVIGHKPVTKEESDRAHEATVAILKSMGLKIKEKQEKEE